MSSNHQQVYSQLLLSLLLFLSLLLKSNDNMVCTCSSPDDFIDLPMLHQQTVTKAWRQMTTVLHRRSRCWFSLLCWQMLDVCCCFYSFYLFAKADVFINYVSIFFQLCNHLQQDVLKTQTWYRSLFIFRPNRRSEESSFEWGSDLWTRIIVLPCRLKGTSGPIFFYNFAKLLHRVPFCFAAGEAFNISFAHWCHWMTKSHSLNLLN